MTHTTSTTQTTQRHAAKLNFFNRYRPPDGEDVPKYQQVRFAMIEAIRDGYWRDGVRLPTEEELVGMTGFSLGTVQRAVRMLVEDGMLARRQGSGTFISHTDSRISEPWHFQFLSEDGETVLPAYPKVVCRERTNQRGPWSRFLGQARAPILRIDRLINVNDEFNAFSRFFVADECADIMEAISIEQLHSANFRVVLSQACRLPVTRIGHTVSITHANSSQARTLSIATQDALLRVEISATAGTKIPLYFQELLSPQTNRRLSLPSVGRLGSK
jgi:DNA-binding GntR family transcriptional regulator